LFNPSRVGRMVVLSSTGFTRGYSHLTPSGSGKTREANKRIECDCAEPGTQSAQQPVDGIADFVLQCAMKNGILVPIRPHLE